MRKLYIRESFLKDVLFNKITQFKIKLINRIVLISGLILNVLAFILYSFTGILLFDNLNSILKIANMLSIISLLTVNHRVSVNNFNISRDISQLENDELLSSSISDVEIIPKNFKLYENIPLKALKGIYRDGAYVLITTSLNEYVIYAVGDEIYLLESDEELEDVKSLKLKQDTI